jgi:hypothetical protein
MLSVKIISLLLTFNILRGSDVVSLQLRKNIETSTTEIDQLYFNVFQNLKEIEIKKPYKKLLLPNKYYLELMKVYNNYELFKTKQEKIETDNKNLKIDQLEKHLSFAHKVRSNIFKASQALML